MTEDWQKEAWMRGFKPGTKFKGLFNYSNNINKIITITIPHDDKFKGRYLYEGSFKNKKGGLDVLVYYKKDAYIGEWIKKDGVWAEIIKETE